jgi:hypothetical protein
VSIQSQIVLILGFILAIFLGPGIAIVLMVRRRKKARAARRSPLTENLLRASGQSLQEQIDDLRDQADYWMSILMFIPVLIGALHLAQSYILDAKESWPRTTLLVLASAVVLIMAVRKILVITARLDRLRLGLDGEVAVGQELNKVMRQGAAVFHDFPAEDFNIDHVVIAPQGVFAIETKGFSKPKNDGGTDDATVVYDGKRLAFPHWSSSAPLEQAARNAKWLADWLARSTGTPVAVTPVLALPGWFVDLKGRGEVRVYSGKQLSSLLDGRRAGPLPEQQVTQIEYQVDQRCRTVRPRYREED